MEDETLFGELAVIGASSVLVALALHRLRLPTAVGFLVAGALFGPHGFALVSSVENIQQIAEVGVMLLLFGIGLEFSFTRLRLIWRPIALGGSVQVGLTAAATVLVLTSLGVAVERAALFGFVVALSSTAVVLRMLSERGEIDAPHGRLIVGVLIFQDLLVVPLTLLIPALAGGGPHPLIEIARALGTAVLVLAGTSVIARSLVPRLFALVDATHSREIFLLAVLSVGIGGAWVMSEIGLSSAFGAFLAGMLLADTDYRHRAITDVIPLRDAFTSVFFVSLGMLFDINVLLDRPGTFLGILAGLVPGKALFAMLAALTMRYPARAALIAGVALAQFGEFGFVLLVLGQREGLVTADEAELIVSVGVASMILSRVLMGVAPNMRAGERLLRPIERLLRARGADELERSEQGLRGHVVVVGYGVGGRLLTRVLRAVGAPHLVVELDAERVRMGRAAGAPIYYGDITSPEVLEEAGVRRSRALVLLINDHEAARRAIAAVRRVTSTTPIVARTRFVADREELRRLGASHVISEELESATEVAAHTLTQVGVDRGAIRAVIAEALRESGHLLYTTRADEWLAAVDELVVDIPPRVAEESAPAEET